MAPTRPSVPAAVAGFTPLPISYSPTAVHVLYVRPHVGPKNKKKDEKGKGKELPEGRTLFMVNVPPDATERELVVLFRWAGTVERVVFAEDERHGQEDDIIEEDEDDDSEQDEDDEMNGVEEAGPTAEDADADTRPRKKRKTTSAGPPPIVRLPSPSTPLRTLRHTGHTAHLIFLDPSALSFLSSSPSSKLPKLPLPWPTDHSAPHGLAHYRALHSALRPSLAATTEHVDSWMAHFEWEEAARRRREGRRARGAGEAEVDEDGFTIVRRGGRYGTTVGGGVGVASRRFQDGAARGTVEGRRGRGRKAKEKKEKDTFYAFQVHEKKRKELMDLKKNWEEDKAKVQKLKESKKFKPY